MPDVIAIHQGRVYAMELKAEAYGLAFESYRKAVALNARNADALAGLSQAAAPARKSDEELS